MNQEIKDVLREMRERKINHGKGTSPTLIAWANRIESALQAAIANCKPEGGL